MQLLDIVSLVTVEICYNGHTTFMLSELYVHLNIIKSVTVMYKYNSLINTNVIILLEAGKLLINA